MLDHLDQRPESICRPRRRLSGRERERAELELLPDLDPVPFFFPVGIAGEERSQSASAPSKARGGGSAPAERSNEGASGNAQVCRIRHERRRLFSFPTERESRSVHEAILGHFLKGEIKVRPADRPPSLQLISPLGRRSA